MALQDSVLERVQLEPGVFKGQVAHTATPGSRVDWGRYGLSVLARGDTARDMVTLTLPLGGHGTWPTAAARTSATSSPPECGEPLVTLPPEAHFAKWQWRPIPKPARGAACTCCLPREPWQVIKLKK